MSTTPKFKNKSITIKDNKKKKNQMDKMSTYILDTDYETNTNTVIKYYEEFSQTRIDALLEEAYSNLLFASENDLDFFKGDQQDSQLMHYIAFLSAVRFTSLSKDVPTTLPEQIPIMSDMYETGLLDRIHEEILPQDEIYKVLERLDKLVALVNDIGSLEESTRNEILATVQNKEVLNYNQPSTPTVDDVNG